MSTVKSWHYYCPTPADKALKQPQGEVIQSAMDDCGVTGTTIKYYTRMHELSLATNAQTPSKKHFLSKSPAVMKAFILHL